jgi:hypothetical protein
MKEAGALRFAPSTMLRMVPLPRRKATEEEPQRSTDMSVNYMMAAEKPA